MANEIKKMQDSGIRIANVTSADLANQEVIDAICLEAQAAQSAEKEAKGAYTAVKDNAKRLFREKFGENHDGTLYSPSNGLKIAQTVKGGGVEVDQTLFLQALYEHFGEEYMSKDGWAWKAFEMVSVPVDCPRVIDPEKFDQMFRTEQAIAAGVSKSASTIPLSVFVGSQVEKKPTIAVSVKGMTKAEKSDYEKYPDEFRTVV